MLRGDSGFHLLLADMVVTAFKDGSDFTDPWQNTMSLGFPIFHYYQHLPHIFIAVVHILSFETISLIDAMKWSSYLLLSFFPLSIYCSLRIFGFGLLTSVMAGLIAPLLGDDFYLWGGLGFHNYTFSGWGLYSQLWGMFLLPLALAMGYRVIKQGTGYCWSALFLSMTLLSHLVFGYMAFITLGGLAICRIVQHMRGGMLLPTTWLTSKRLFVLFMVVILASSYFVIPFFVHGEYFNTSVVTGQMGNDQKFSFGHMVILDAVVKGKLFDLGRFPAFTILVFIGLIACGYRWREERYIVPIAVFGLWLLLFFGRPTWGPFIDLIPLIESVHMHRFIAGVHLGGILLGGIGLGVIWDTAISSGKSFYVCACLAVTILLLVTMYIDRRSYLQNNDIQIQNNRMALESQADDLNLLVRTLHSLPSGRVFVAQQEVTRNQTRYTIEDVPVYVLLHNQGFDVLSNLYHRYSYPSLIVSLFDQNEYEHYDLFNVRYVVAPREWAPPDFAEFIQSSGRHYLYQVQTTGYFALVGTERTFSVRQQDFYDTTAIWMNSNLIRNGSHPELVINQSSRSQLKPEQPRIVRTIQSDLSGTSMTTENIRDGSIRGTLIKESVGQGIYSANVIVTLDSMLLLKSPYHPNWTANVNGVAVETYHLMPGFIGIMLPPGQHEIVVEYQSWILRKILLGLGVISFILVGIWDITGKMALFVNSFGVHVPIRIRFGSRAK